jgi:hypothetical protein
MRESKDVAFTARRHDEIGVVETTIEQAAVWGSSKRITFSDEPRHRFLARCRVDGFKI